MRSGYGCGRCEACARGEPRACPKRGGTYGYTDVGKPPHLWGGYAEHLRVQAGGEPHRIFHALDRRRAAILLIGGNKAGDDRFYERMIPVADRIYDEHLEELDREERAKDDTEEK